jgi:hypothetical protein
MAFDYKKEYKEFYMPAATPGLVTVPPMNYIAVAGQGDPNAPDSEYKQSIGLLYGVAYTLKMSKMTDHRMDGYFDFVVPPLEGFWWQEGASGMDYGRKEDFRFLSAIRLPDFVTPADVTWAVETATVKRKMDFSPVQFCAMDEGLCVQCLHVGPYDDEPETVERMHRYMTEQGCVLDITDQRRHHEIYLSDARRVPPEKWKTVVRHPVKRI